MKDADELNLALLERSLAEHENARANFIRDLKIAVVLLIAFQFFVFFRFTKLSDQQFELHPKLEQAETSQKALVEIGAAVEKIETTLKTGTDEVSKLLGNLPEEIRNELNHLTEDVKKFRAAPFPPPREEMPVQSPMQMPNQFSNFANRVGSAPSLPTRNESRFLDDLTFDESAAFHAAAADPNSPPYRQRVIQIVETKIIQPAFEKLNARADTLVIAPLASGVDDLRKRTAARATLKAAGANVDGWVTNAEQVVTVSKNLKFSPPDNVDWWMDARTKENFANTAKLDTSKIADAARSALSRPDTELKSLAEKMELAIAGLEQQSKQIDEDLEQLRENAVSLEGLIEGYAKPLSILALQPKDLVIFYPVILAAIICTFAVRQVLLRRRATVLAGAYRDLGVSNEILGVYFTELPVSREDRKSASAPPWARARRFFAGWLWVVPAGFAVASFAWVLSSKSLGGEAPRLLYFVSALVLVAAGFLLLRSARERVQAA